MVRCRSSFLIRVMAVTDYRQILNIRHLCVFGCLSQINKRPVYQVFYRCIRNPDRRVTEGEWVHAFRQLENQIARCPHDRAENFCSPDEAIAVLALSSPFDAPPRFVISSSSGLKHVLVLPETKLRRSELEPFCSEESMDEVVAEVIQNPNNPNVWGLRNLTGESWQSCLPMAVSRVRLFRDVPCLFPQVMKLR